MNWLALSSPFLWLITKLFDITKWSATTAYNGAVELAEFIFKEIIGLFCWTLDFLPDYDLSAYENGLNTLFYYFSAFDSLLPFTEITLSVLFLIGYFTMFTLIRLILKLIPGIG
ncbi:MAG: hypothetical protein IJ387_04125 [Thermoguttaceae bacterium]|nr:hypothetical protein [Thermoguttaceae bacterium]